MVLLLALQKVNKQDTCSLDLSNLGCQSTCPSRRHSFGSAFAAGSYNKVMFHPPIKSVEEFDPDHACLKFPLKSLSLILD